jgi:glycosyl hydrolase family 12
MAAGRKFRKLLLLATVLVLLGAGAFGWHVLTGSPAPQAATLAGTSRTANKPATVYACRSGSKLTHVSTAAAPKCPAKSVPVHWAAPGTKHPSPSTAPSPSPHPSSPRPKASRSPSSGQSPSPSSAPAPSSPASGTTCVTSGLSGVCGPYSDPNITDADGYNTDVANNMWGCGAIQPGQPGAYCGPETIRSYGPADWSVTSNQKAGNTGVLSYPDVAQVFTRSDNTDPPIKAFSAITSTFTETMNATAGTDAEAAYDLWVDNGSAVEEVMIWVDNHGQTPAGNQKGSVVIGGTTYHLWTADGTVSFVRSNEQSGSVDILAVLHWLQSNGYLISTADLGQVDFGWEICSTAGVPETFNVSGYTLKNTCSSACTG